MIEGHEVDRLARTLADEIGESTDGVVAGLLLELVRRPGAQAHRSILLGNSTQWRALIRRALESADLAEATAVTRSNGVR